MKLAALLETKERPLIDMPSDVEIKAAKVKFQNEVKAAKYIYHVTSEKNADKIMRNGLKAGSYLSFRDVAWEGDIRLVMNGADVYRDVYPDPEQMYESKKLLQLFTPTDNWNIKTVLKFIDRDLLFWLFYDFCRQEDFPEEIPDGAWLVTLAPIPASVIEEE